MPAAHLFKAAVLILALSWVSSLHGTDAPALTIPSSEEQYKQIVREYQQQVNDFRARYKKAITDEERQKIAHESSPDRAASVARCLALARQFPRSDGAFKALIFVIGRFQDDDATRDALDLLRAEYLDREKLVGPSEWYGNFNLVTADLLLRDLAVKSPHRSVRGAATLSLGRRAVKDGSPDAAKLLERAAAEYGDLRTNERTIKEVADGELRRLRELAVGKIAPEIEGVDTDGAAMKLSDFRGKVVLLDFWGYW